MSGATVSNASQRAERARGRAYAREWRERWKPYFDGLYGPDRCIKCGPKMEGTIE